ncbi:hypothetical protein ATL41_2324 [Flavimobilis soli]|uniref:AB hydrolase-1 domain-containing protein n=1 Tax=Flavimobilis soli TaxID=442709 RepID=A0A2A9EEU1_9MICO|nr:alpha/beta fold hydrolase [Flavimobilis soli]PFG37557.1 hypothetical protein ATL41_2324 [Flavimobilis soli]
MTTPQNAPTILMIAGHWLGAWAWDEVSACLDALGHRAVPLTLPGLDSDDPDRSGRTLDEQAAAIEAALAADAAGKLPVVVAHSGANLPVSLVLDRNPQAVGHVVWVDSGPVAPGSVLAPNLPEEVAAVPLPPFDVLGARASLEGLDAAALARFRARAVPQPAAVVRTPVDLANDARHDVPTTLVCCSISVEQVLELANSGHPMFSEVSRLSQVDMIDLPTGHWPMWSRPADLARVIADVASGA